ncbi:hypothetical protein [Microcoleus sp. Pol10D4]|uniref:hypothetical protein n=1 Tax=Microcoleus sp. Pol10D4 TaxID=3055387 RepID=UPI002FD7258F
MGDDRGLYQLLSGWLHNYCILLDDARLLGYILLLGISPGSFLDDQAAPLAFYRFLSLAAFFQIPVGRKMVVMMMSFLMSD